MIPWIYGEHIVDEVPSDCRNKFNSGFIYLLKFKNGMYYIGKKSFYRRATALRLADGSKRPLHISWDRSRKKERYYKESNWLTYCGSGEGYNKKDIISREILHYCYTKYQLTYWEASYLFVEGVPLNDKLYNDNILGKFYRERLIEEK